MIRISGHSITAPVRTIKAKVELYNGSTLVDTYNHSDIVKSIEVERIGEDSKFFGFGICQKVKIKLIDKDRKLNITTANSFKVFFQTTETTLANVYPTFYIFNSDDIKRDEKTNELTIIAYDAIKNAYYHTYNELSLTSYSVTSYATAIRALIGLSSISKVNLSGDTTFDAVYDAPNLDGSESLKALLDAIAEITQTIYYVDGNNRLVFKRLSTSSSLIIDKSQYFTLDTTDNKTLTAVAHITDLGNNVTASLDNNTGSTHYLRNNPFWDLREDVDTLLNSALDIVGGTSIQQFTCNWRGDYRLEIGDRIAFTTKDNSYIYSYLFNDVITYNGSLNEVTQWKYTNDDKSIHSNSASLGEIINRTVALVDKINKEINLIVNDTSADKELLASITVALGEITNTVKSVEKVVTEDLPGMGEQIAELEKTVDTKMTPEQYEIFVKETLSNGVDKVETSTGFKFNDEGLTVSKSNSGLSTNINENGMRVTEIGEEVLTADNSGVKAKNLHATTYLIIGNNSRFEDYGNRTGCFWIGG